MASGSVIDRALRTTSDAAVPRFTKLLYRILPAWSKSATLRHRRSASFGGQARSGAGDAGPTYHLALVPGAVSPKALATLHQDVTR